MVEEVRRQFREIAGLLDGKKGVKADYARCVDIATAAALKRMIIPGLMAVLIPVVGGVPGALRIRPPGLVASGIQSAYLPLCQYRWAKTF